MNKKDETELSGTLVNNQDSFVIFNKHEYKRKKAMVALNGLIREIKELESEYYLNKLPTTKKLVGIFTVGISLNGFWSVLVQIEKIGGPIMCSLDLDFGYFDPIQEAIIKAEIHKLLND